MSSLEKSQLLNNISNFNIDNRISKFELCINGITNRFGQRVSSSPGHSSVIIDRRHYIQGDPIKDIDWKLTAKTDKLYTKIRESYKQSKIHIVIDNSKSMKVKYNNFLSKFDLSLLLTYIISSIALKERDSLHIYYQNDFEKICNSSELLDLLLKIENDLDYLIFDKVLNIKKTYFFIFSDYFLSLDKVILFYKNLINLNIITAIIKDKHEQEFLFGGSYKLINPEDEQNPVASEIKFIKNKYIRDYKSHFINLINEFKKLNLKHNILYNNLDPISEFLRMNI